MQMSSRSTPVAAHAQRYAVAVVANMANGTGWPGLSRFQAIMLRLINTTQIIEPPISRSAPK